LSSTIGKNSWRTGCPFLWLRIVLVPLSGSYALHGEHATVTHNMQVRG
jgi:hypothetical protein